MVGSNWNVSTLIPDTLARISVKHVIFKGSELQASDHSNKYQITKGSE